MKTKPALYLDIDGVILTRDLKAPKGLVVFLIYVLEHFDCYWLTTHCKGDKTVTIRYLSTVLHSSIIILLQEIKPTNWNTLKTEAIDFSRPFFWLDDTPFDSEKAELKNQGALDRLIVVDLDKDDEFQRVMKMLKWCK